jgi:hypothetical protein
MTRFVSITYFSYNAPAYYGCIGLLTIFGVFYTMLHLALKYEMYNKINKCDPMYYYGQACRNDMATTLLTDPEFLQAKHAFYDKISKYESSNQAYIGAQRDTENDQKAINLADTTIQSNLDGNHEFTENTIADINDITDFAKMLSTKYLGDVQTLVGSVKDEDSLVETRLKTIPAQLAILKNQINTAVVTPTMARYSAPLKKLYKSLTDMTLNTNEYSGPTTKPA